MKSRTKLLLVALALALFAWAGVALAQAAGGFLGFVPDLAALYVSPFALSLAIGAIVQVAKKHFLNISGGAVLLLSFAVGILLGMAGVWAGYLAGSVIEGAAFGLIAALIASGLYDLIKEFFARLGLKLPDWNPQPAVSTALPLLVGEGVTVTTGGAPATQPAGFLNPDSLLDYVTSLIKGRFGNAVPDFAWGIIGTLGKEFAGRALTPDVQREIQHRFLDLLAKAGAPGRDV